MTEELETARLQAAIAAKAIKPRSLRRNGERMGDGPECPEEGEHGNLYVMQPSGRLWCAVSQALFADSVHTPDNRLIAGAMIREGDHA